MLVDARSLDDGQVVEAEVCIIGAGAAGIALARKLIGSGTKVMLLEGGGLEFDPQSQSLYEGDIIGQPYHPLDVCRLRYFGGTTNHWAGYCWPFKPETFAKRSWVPHSGWPIGQQDLAPYYDSAAQLLDLPVDGWHANSGWDLARWAERLDGAPIAFDPAVYDQRVAFINPLRMGEVFLDELKTAPNIQLFLNANVVEIESDAAASLVSGLRVKTFNSKEITFNAKAFVLAAGGIENARLLLVSNGSQPRGLGNQHDLVGRYFMDHVMAPIGFIQLTDPQPPIGLYNRRKRRDVLNGLRFVLGLDSRASQEEDQQLIPVGLYLEPVLADFYQAEGVRSLRQLYAALRNGDLPEDLGELIANVAADLEDVARFSYAKARYDEKSFARLLVLAGLTPAPNRDSRVSLAEKRDALGMPRIKLDWRLSEIDHRSALWMADRFGADAALAGLGRFKLTLADNLLETEGARGTRHHIGTTRMAARATEGVVDRDCKVFGMENLFVAGSSVFTTCGKGSPTLAIIALAERLADHLMERFS